MKTLIAIIDKLDGTKAITMSNSVDSFKRETFNFLEGEIKQNKPNWLIINAPDMQIVLLGEIDDKTGKITAEENPKVICTIAELIEPIKKAAEEKNKESQGESDEKKNQ